MEADVSHFSSNLSICCPDDSATARRLLHHHLSAYAKAKVFGQDVTEVELCYRRCRCLSQMLEGLKDWLQLQIDGFFEWGTAKVVSLVEKAMQPLVTHLIQPIVGHVEDFTTTATRMPPPNCPALLCADCWRSPSGQRHWGQPCALLMPLSESGDCSTCCKYPNPLDVWAGVGQGQGRPLGMRLPREQPVVLRGRMAMAVTCQPTAIGPEQTAVGSNAWPPSSPPSPPHSHLLSRSPSHSDPPDLVCTSPRTAPSALQGS